MWDTGILPEPSGLGSWGSRTQTLRIFDRRFDDGALVGVPSWLRTATKFSERSISGEHPPVSTMVISNRPSRVIWLGLQGAMRWFLECVAAMNNQTAHIGSQSKRLSKVR
jgi:hypothetical protein